jgi:SAM-dependent methyltransferase
MVRQAERRFRREVAGGRMEIRRGKVEALPFDDGRFDRVVSVNTIYFWPDPAAAASELRRVLRPGGRVVLALRPKEQMEKLPTSRHGFRLFSETDLTELLKGAGFSETRVEVRNRSLFGMADVS